MSIGFENRKLNIIFNSFNYQTTAKQILIPEQPFDVQRSRIGHAEDTPCAVVAAALHTVDFET